MTILVLNGPNLNMLGKRDHNLYGNKTLKEIENLVLEKAKKIDVSLLFFQSNHEGSLIDFIQEKRGHFDGILINAGALSHYGYSLLDGLLDAAVPFVSVHLSDIKNRELFRQRDIFEHNAIAVISGNKEQSYVLGLETLIEYIEKEK